MSLEYLEPLLLEFNHELFLYPWDIFELRIQEEMVRADRSGSGFGYMEIPFSALRKVIRENVDDRTLWRAILKFLAETMRGSDIKGFLAQDRGLGLVFLDSQVAGVEECCSRLWMMLGTNDWLIPDCGEPSLFKITGYPLEKLT